MAEVRVATRFDKNRIMQVVTFESKEDPIHTLMGRVLELQDEAAKQALIALGWTPPKED